jgi:hypothetical protein
MNTVEDALSAIRTVESDSDYKRQQSVKVGEKRDRKLGAYGILESKWGGFAASMGYTGADWRDPTMQDKMARAKLERDYDELGDWTLAVVSFRFGLGAARAMKEANYFRAADVEMAGEKQIGRYMRDIDKTLPKTDRPVMPTPPSSKPAPQDPTLRRSEDVVRRHLYGMRNQQRLDKPVEEESPDVVEEPV